MKRVFKELIEYNGIDTSTYENLINFKQFQIENIFEIPNESPDVEQIIKVWVDYDIEEQKIIKTHKGCSCEGQILTGYKVFIYGDLKIKLEYISDKYCNSVHSMNLKLPFSSYTNLDETYNEYSTVCPSVHIEDIYCDQISSRNIYFNITLMSIVDIC